MSSNVESQSVALAMELLDVVPGLLRQIHLDILTSWNMEDEVRQQVSEILTFGQMTLLRLLVQHERCSMQELADYVGVTPSTMTTRIKSLLAQGYVERGRDDADWRTVWIKPTERGYCLVNTYNQDRLISLQRRLEQLDEEEHAHLIAALPALRHLIVGRKKQPG